MIVKLVIAYCQYCSYHQTHLSPPTQNVQFVKIAVGTGFCCIPKWSIIGLGIAADDGDFPRRQFATSFVGGTHRQINRGRDKQDFLTFEAKKWIEIVCFNQCVPWDCSVITYVSTIVWVRNYTYILCAYTTVLLVSVLDVSLHIIRLWRLWNTAENIPLLICTLLRPFPFDFLKIVRKLI